MRLMASFEFQVSNQKRPRIYTDDTDKTGLKSGSTACCFRALRLCLRAGLRQGGSEFFLFVFPRLKPRAGFCRPTEWDLGLGSSIRLPG